MGLYKKAQSEKSVSLNEARRLKEKDENEARQKARDRERLTRKAPVPTIEELTLKPSDQPGEGPSVTKSNIVATVTSPTSKPAGQLGGETSVTGTNSGTAVTSSKTKNGEPQTATEEDKPQPVDATLDEAEHILADYVSLLAKESAVSLSR